MRRKLLILMIALVAMLYEFTGIRIATASDSVVRIGSEYYSSIDTAVAASKTGDIIEFMCNTEWTVPIVVEAEKSIIIDFRGYSITFPENTTAPSLGGLPLLDVRGDLTLRNGNVLFGKLGAGMGIQNNGKLTIDSGTYKLRIPATATGSGDMICNYGELIINGGTFDSDDILYQDKNSSLSQQVAPSLTINGGTFICPSNANNLLWAKAGSVTVNGGVFSKVGLRCENKCEINDGSFNCHLLFFGPTIIRGGEFKCAFGGRCGDYDDSCIYISGGTSLTIFGGIFDELDIVNRSSKVSVYGGRFKTTNALVIDEQKYIVTPVTRLFGGIYQTKPSESRIAIKHEIKYKQGVGYEIIPIGFCAERNGWPVLNYYKAFSDVHSNNFEIDDYFASDITLSTIVNGILAKSTDFGYCFGLSLTSIAQYNKQIELKNYLTRDGEYLNEYGYEGLEYAEAETRDGKKISGYILTLKDNELIVDIIQKAHLTQYSSTFWDCEVFDGDGDYSEVIAYLSQENVSPLLVELASGHAIVTDTTIKPQQIPDGRWLVYCYDCNSARSSIKDNSIKLWPQYFYEKPYLLLNPQNGEWQYVENGKIKYQNQYNTFDIKNLFSIRTIEFFDISKLPVEFFYGKHNLYKKEELNGIIATDIKIASKQNGTLFTMETGNPEIANSNTEYHIICNDTIENTNRREFFVIIPSNDNPIFISKDKALVWRFDEDNLIIYKIDGNGSVQFNDDINEITISNLESGNNVIFEIAIQNQDGSKVVHAKGTLESNTRIVLTTQFSNEDVISANTTSDENLIETTFIHNGYNAKTDYHKRRKLNGIVTLNGAAVFDETLSASVSETNNTGILTYTWERNGRIISEGESYNLTADDIGNTLTCKVTSTVETGCISATTAVITKQAGPAAPVNLIGVAPTLFNGRNGKIVGTTAEMELSDAASFASTIVCGNGETDSLAAGTYYVRYKETETASAGEYATVVVPEYIKKSPVIQYPEGNQTVNVEIGKTASMSVVAENGIDYQWFVDRNDGKGFVAIHGAENEGYTTTPTKKENEGYRYFCRVTNIDGFVDSPIFTLHVVQLDSLPETGDHSNWVYWMIMAVACTAAVFLLVHKQRAE